MEEQISIKSYTVIGFTYGYDTKNNAISFGTLEPGDIIDITVRDQYGWRTGCKEENFRRITGEVTSIEEAIEGTPEQCGKWIITVSEIPLDEKKIRRRIEENLRKSASKADLIKMAVDFKLPLL
ncbi:MAG: hypothetical protein ABII94_01605 [Patescibacteria group bacterium]|uniref:Uncharacterized protein n=1 Tax=viral metagenome TaxID=1070528 RepID=A0A6H2A2K8_9ZZZZ